MKVKANPVKRFNNPINVGGDKVVNSSKDRSVAEQTERYLSERRRRKLEDAKDAELDLAAEQSKTEASRQRKERERIESGRDSPIRGEEGAMENVSDRVAEAAEVAAEAASAGVSPEEARNLATGKQKVVIVQGAGQGARTAEETLRERAEVIEQAKALYCSCIDAGGDPKRCADMVAGLIPSQPGASSPQATSITELVSALTALDTLRGSNKGLEDLKVSFDNLAAEMRKGPPNQQPPLDPVAYAEQQAKALVAWQKAIQEVIPTTTPTSGEGKNLEVVKEENRHSEKMEEIKVDRDYKGDIVSIAADIPERLGQGIADRYGKGGGDGGGRGRGRGSGGGGSLSSITCTEKGCGTKIYITPETGDEIVCPECGMIYQKRQTVESSTE